jgi:hypothetical protein
MDVDDDDLGCDATAEKKKGALLRCSETVDHVITIVIQAASEGDPSGVLSNVNLKGIHYNSNPGHVVERLLKSLGLEWSSCGKALWRREDTSKSLVWRTLAGTGSRRPVAPRRLALGGLPSNLSHDTEAAASGPPGARAAAAAMRPSAPQLLERIAPNPSDFLTRGSGWGNTPRPLSECCFAEQVRVPGSNPATPTHLYLAAPGCTWMSLIRLDSFVSPRVQASIFGIVGRVQDHAFRCGARLRGVEGGTGKAFWSSHSMGVVNVFTLTCERGCTLNCATAAPLPSRRRGRRHQTEGVPGRHPFGSCATRSLSCRAVLCARTVSVAPSSGPVSRPSTSHSSVTAASPRWGRALVWTGPARTDAAVGPDPVTGTAASSATSRGRETSGQATAVCPYLDIFIYKFVL